MMTHSFTHRRLVLFILSSLVVLSVCSSTLSQQKRSPANRPKPTATPPGTPTFDTLLAADTYKIYGEVRGVGQLIRSNSVNELLEPVMKIAAPPKELSTLLKWLNKHADAVMTSRMLVAAWPTAKDVPSVLVAIEFGSAEEAERFEPQLNDFLPRVLPTPSPTPSTSPEPEGSPGPGDKQKPTSPPPPSYYLSRAGSLIFITSTRLNLKNLRPAGSKLLSEGANFQTARTRFGSEQLFVYVDFDAIQKEEDETTKRVEEEVKKKQTEQAAEAATPKEPDTSTPTVRSDETAGPTPTPVPQLETAQAASSSEQKQQAQLDPMSLATGLISSMFSSGQAKWPEGLGIAISLDNESLDAKVLMVNPPGEKSDAIPLIPLLIPGPSINPEGASILPADTELLVTVSLDWGQIYSRLSKPAGPTVIAARDERNEGSPVDELEKKLGIKVQEDLVPLLGSELSVAIPVTESTAIGDSEKEKEKSQSKSKEPSPVIALAVRDKAGMKVLLPKIIEAMGFKGASALGQTEKRGDTEIVSYANALGYAFVGNFLVVSPDVANVRRVVDSYLKSETLSADANFKNYTRWQPRQLQAQVYLSPALMESYKTWAQEPTALISDQTREFLTRLTFISQPVTYSLSNDGLGSLHELHVPKTLLVMLVASISGETNPPPMLANERSALSAVHMIAAAEIEYRAAKGSGSFGTLDQLVAEKDYLKNAIQNSNYKIEVTVSGNHFEVSAIPTEYGKTGRMSYFTDETQVVRGGDMSGAPATVASKPVAN